MLQDSSLSSGCSAAGLAGPRIGSSAPFPQVRREDLPLLLHPESERTSEMQARKLGIIGESGFGFQSH